MLQVIRERATARLPRLTRSFGVLGAYRPIYKSLTSSIHGLGWWKASFIAMVLAPTFIGFAYLECLASNEYVSEAQFTVRSGSGSGNSMQDIISSMTASVGLESRYASQDVFIVSDYIRSRTIIEDLGGKYQVTRLFSKPSIDFFSRLNKSAALEQAWKYWRRKVSAIIDTPSGIVTLEVRAFDPHEAFNLAQNILARAEGLLNAISERSRRDTLSRAEQEVTLAQERLEQSRVELLDFRTRNSIIDPGLSAKSVSENLTKLI